MNFQKWKPVHSHHLHEHNLLLLLSNVKQNHAREAKLRAAQSIVKTPGPNLEVMLQPRRKNKIISGNHWPFGWSWVTHLESLNGGFGMSVNIIYFTLFCEDGGWKRLSNMPKVTQLVQKQSLEKTLEVLNPTQLNIHSTETQVSQGNMKTKFSLQAKWAPWSHKGAGWMPTS